MFRHRTSPSGADPEPAAGDQDVDARNAVVKENYPHTFATQLSAPSEVDLQRFWMLERPLNLCNPFDRDRLHLWIQESIDRSCDWIDLRHRLQIRDPIVLALHEGLLAEAYALLAYKRACLALLAKLEEPPTPKPPQATNLTDDEIKARITSAERSLAKCGDAYVQRTLRATIRHWQEALARSSGSKAVKPQSLMRERYVAAWAQKQALR